MSQTAYDVAQDMQAGLNAEAGNCPASAGRENRTDGSPQQAVRRALSRPRYEIIPMRGALEQTCKLPVGSTVTVTCSPSRGVSATIDLAEQIHKLGYTAVPHLAAKRFGSRSHLEETVARMTEAGIQDVFVVGGDGDAEGPFSRGADIVATLAELRPDLRSVGIPCYPEGHAFIAAELLDEALDDKCFFAGHMVTQICFDVDVIGGWLKRIRERGVGLPVFMGIPGVIERRKLIGIALKIGLGESTRFLKKNGSFMGRLAGPSRFTPDALIDAAAGLLNDPALGVAGLHVNTFNQVESTEAWRRERLSALVETASSETEAVAGVSG